MNVSLCLIVWNELGGCWLDVPKIPRDSFHEVFAIDGGSTDGTVEYLASQGIPVHPQTKRGLNAAYVDANRIASGEAVVVYFPKGTIPPEDLLKFIPLLEDGKALVIASRKIKGSRNEEDSQFLKPRKWAVLLLAVSAALIWCREGVWIRDVLHGVKAWNRRAFDQMQILDHGLSIDIEMVIRSYKLRLPRCEFPTKELSRPHGESTFKFLPTGRKLLAYLRFELLRKA